MKKEMKNWNGPIELRPHWSSHTQAPKSPPEALPPSQRPSHTQALKSPPECMLRQEVSYTALIFAPDRKIGSQLVLS